MLLFKTLVDLKTRLLKDETTLSQEIEHLQETLLSKTNEKYELNQQLNLLSDLDQNLQGFNEFQQELRALNYKAPVEELEIKEILGCPSIQFKGDFMTNRLKDEKAIKKYIDTKQSQRFHE